ncbi:MAG TPA: hypothetical protein VGR28_11490 [Candidatus Thermoplasmatota archaeon]|nr:hypothetical protein [Candidatus Thermoplasmatota archaeon]
MTPDEGAKDLARMRREDPERYRVAARLDFRKAFEIAAKYGR